MENKIPNEIDWGNWQATDKEDVIFAHNFYIGKSNQDLQEYFTKSPCDAAFDDLLFMPTVPFQYYVLGFRDSVLAKGHDEIFISSAASSFLKMILERLRRNASDVTPVIHELWPSLEYVATHQSEFDAEVEIYGDFQLILNEIKMAIV